MHFRRSCSLKAWGHTLHFPGFYCERHFEHSGKRNLLWVKWLYCSHELPKEDFKEKRTHCAETDCSVKGGLLAPRTWVSSFSIERMIGSQCQDTYECKLLGVWIHIAWIPLYKMSAETDSWVLWEELFCICPKGTQWVFHIFIANNSLNMQGDGTHFGQNTFTFLVI